MIITICGPPGSGKDTVANILLEKIIQTGKNYELLSIGDLRRIAALQKKMTIEQFNEWSLKNPKEGDAYFDKFQNNYAKKTSDFILVSRLGWYLIPQSYKIYLDVESYEGARRIFEQKRKDHNSRNEIICESVDKQIKDNKEKVESDKKRFSVLYNINPYKKENFDLVIDTTHKKPEKVVSSIMEKIRS